MGRWVSSPSYRAAVRVLIEARRAAGLTQRQLADRLGRPYTVIANVERGERRIDVVEFIAVARALGIGELELMARVGNAIGPALEL
ncbi:MAG TPA: helix-turn-helix transcriptional regulator [Caulobacteraceae bacterium]